MHSRTLGLLLSTPVAMLALTAQRTSATEPVRLSPPAVLLTPESPIRMSKVEPQAAPTQRSLRAARVIAAVMPSVKSESKSTTSEAKVLESSTLASEASVVDSRPTTPITSSRRTIVQASPAAKAVVRRETPAPSSRVAASEQRRSIMETSPQPTSSLGQATDMRPVGKSVLTKRQTRQPEVMTATTLAPIASGDAEQVEHLAPIVSAADLPRPGRRPRADDAAAAEAEAPAIETMSTPVQPAPPPKKSKSLLSLPSKIRLPDFKSRSRHAEQVEQEAESE
jgi:hypothetical protein